MSRGYDVTGRETLRGRDGDKDQITCESPLKRELDDGVHICMAVLPSRRQPCISTNRVVDMAGYASGGKSLLCLRGMPFVLTAERFRSR